MSRYFVAVASLLLLTTSNTSAAKVRHDGPVTLYCPTGQSCTEVEVSVNGMSRGCSRISQYCQNNVCENKYQLTCSENHFMCDEGCAETAFTDIYMPEMGDMGMGDESSTAGGTSSSSSGSQGNCCSVFIVQSCPTGFTESGTVMDNGASLTPCCYSSGGTVYGGTIGGGMPSCDGFVPDVLKGGAGTGTGTSNGSSGGTGGTADGLDCASLLAEHPECQTCVYKCGSEPSKCAGGLTGMCSPVCFSGKLTTCQVGGGDVNNEMVETDATSDGDTLKMNVMLKGIMMMAAAGMLYFSF